MADDTPHAKPRRTRFQIHPSTAIVLMFAAGALVWANMREAHRFTLNQNVPGFSFTNNEVKWSEYGWPFEATSRLNVKDLTGLPPSLIADLNGTNYIAVAINLTIALLILFSVRYACEWLIRRRAARRGA